MVGGNKHIMLSDSQQFQKAWLLQRASIQKKNIFMKRQALEIATTVLFIRTMLYNN